MGFPQSKTDRAIFLSAACYQAVQLGTGKHENAPILPTGFQWVRNIVGISDEVVETFGFIAISKDTILIAFRGTETGEDVLEDLYVRQVRFPYVNNSGYTNKGFTDIYSSLRNPQKRPGFLGIIKVIRSLPPRTHLVIAGHSLGGALATMLALDTAVNTAYSHPIVYTFGSPRVGDEKFAAKFNSILKKGSVRVANERDLIPHLPFELFDYQHVQQLFSISFGYCCFYPSDHYIEDYFFALTELDQRYYEWLLKHDAKFVPKAQSDLMNGSNLPTRTHTGFRDARWIGRNPSIRKGIKGLSATRPHISDRILTDDIT